MIIRIKGLKAQTVIGIYPEERQAPRPLVLHIGIEYADVTSDRIEDVPDYAVIEQKIVESLRAQQFNLLETLADHVARLVLGDARVREVTVEIEKPGVMRHADMVSVVHHAKR